MVPPTSARVSNGCNLAATAALDLRPHQEAVTLTVFREGRYQQLPLRIPERKLGVALHTLARPR